MRKILSSYYFNFIVCSLFACVGCYLLIAETGVMRSFPLIVLCGAACGALNMSARWKCILFAVFALVYSGLYSGDTVESLLICAGICTAIALIALLGTSLIRKKRAAAIVFGALCIAASFGAHYFLFSDIFSASDADSKISSYLSSTYRPTELDGYVFAFDPASRSFRASVKIPSDPTNDGVYVTCRNGKITDAYMRYVECSLMKSRTVDLTTAIRDANAKAGFKVYARSIRSFPPDDVTISTEVRGSDVSYFVYVTNEMSVSEFCATARKYVADAVGAGVRFDTITFIGGEKGTKYYQLTLGESLVYGELTDRLEKYDYITFTREAHEYTS